MEIIFLIWNILVEATLLLGVLLVYFVLHEKATRMHCEKKLRKLILYTISLAVLVAFTVCCKGMLNKTFEEGERLYKIISIIEYVCALVVVYVHMIIHDIFECKTTKELTVCNIRVVVVSFVTIWLWAIYMLG